MLINLQSGELCFFSPCQGRLNRAQADMPPSYAAHPFLQILFAPLADHPVEMGLSLSCWVLVAKGYA
jgi:hypothetical protein